MSGGEFWKRKWQQGHAAKRKRTLRQGRAARPRRVWRYGYGGLWERTWQPGMKRRKKWVKILCGAAAVWLLAIFVMLLTAKAAWAASPGEEEPGTWATEDFMGLEALDFSEIDKFLEEREAGPALTMESVMDGLIKGDLSKLWGNILDSLKHSLFSEISVGGHLIGQVLALGFTGAVFTNFSSVFSSGEIS